MQVPMHDGTGIGSIDLDDIERCRRIATPTWSDALDRLGIAGPVMPLPRRAGSLPLIGQVVTVAEEVGELGSAFPSDFGIDLILAECGAGQIVLIQQRGGPPASAIGGLAAQDAEQARALGGAGQT